ncbi:hypothetical protein QA612_00525 [Evansella sp. AB-P1]|uniref:hypothetical protein n=1 Tax=Evansella sp. AB-P1 TaxID=3037653 RepID=UPI00241FB1E6|nr:hypothetical protein [Evansella sp. AB-P1]MDG5785955.1 hypothetical protein [Evansella sp. AB-P1]
MSKFFHRFFISVLSVVIFSALLAGFQYHFSAAGELGFGMLLGIYVFYTAPVFILGGIPASYAVDAFLKKDKKELASKLETYLRSVGMYGVAGIVVAMIYSALTSLANGQLFFTFAESFQSILIGIVAAIVYYNISLLLQVNWEKLKEQHREREQANESY